MSSDQARSALRTGDSPSLRRRRRITLLSAIGLVDFALISLYQVGAIRRLPDLPGKIFDSNKVNASRAAYPLGIPDATLGAIMYATTMALAGARGTRQTGRRPLFSLALAGVTLVGVSAAARYLWQMVFRERRACPYCLVGAAVSFAMVPPALRELST